jgi:ABC-type branched-subunit amino acid transport system ATPase component
VTPTPRPPSLLARPEPAPVGSAKPAVLEVVGLTAGYGDLAAVRDVSLAVGRGEIVALYGANGAGKTTLLRAISGLLTPTAGTVALDGDDLGRVSAESRARRGIVQVRGADVFAGLTVDENLRAALVAHPEARRDATARIARVYDVFPALAAHRKQDAASLSGGEQQMVALGGALLFEPKVLLVDELSLGLAPLVVQRLLEVLGTLRDEGQAMVVVEQSFAVAARLTDRVVFVEKGAIRFDGAPADLAADAELAKAVFLGGTR